MVMPRCEGRSDGPGHHQQCPESRNDSSVHRSQGDLMLCDACEVYRFPELVAAGCKTDIRKSNRITSRSNKPPSEDSGSNAAQVQLQSGPSTGVKRDGVPASPADLLVTDVPGVGVLKNEHGSAAHNTLPPVVCSDLLMYVNYFRDRAEIDNVKNVLVSFYSCSEISDAKKQLTMLGVEAMSCEFATERQSSTQRSASEAEVDDIFGLFDVLDHGGLLENVKFAACNYDRLPTYGPEDLNRCELADRQSRTENAFAALSAKVDLLASSNQKPATYLGPDSNQIVEMFDKKLQASTQVIQDQLRQLTSVCTQLKVSNPIPGDSSHSDMRARPIDRTRNLVVSGVEEGRDAAVWRSTVDDVLCKAAGRNVQILDAFRIGGRFDPTKARPRPILIKLHSTWDRRIVLNGAHNLATEPRFTRVFLSPDEPTDVRRQNTLERLKKRAVRDGKHVSANNGVLLIDGITVFSLERGYVRRHDGVNVSSPGTDG